MTTARSQFTGAAGQFYVAYGLAARQINASLTVGNAPSVDVLAAAPDGLSTLSFQVKTSTSAYRRNRYGEEGFEWDVGASVIGKHCKSFWYAFVDLQADAPSVGPRVFFVPSRWVAEFVKPGWSRSMYFLPSKAKDLCLERWDLVSDYLAGKAHALDWAADWPESRLTKWGDAPQS